jgi:NAD+ diphosphatase
MSFLHHYAPLLRPKAADLVIVLQANQLLVQREANGGVRLPDCSTVSAWHRTEQSLAHLGLLDGRNSWLCSVGQADQAAPTGWIWQEIRPLLPFFTPAQNHAVGCALELRWWSARSRFCGSCGTPMEDAPDERARRCPKCGAFFYPSASPAVIVAVTRGDKLLLAHNRNFSPGLFSLLAGFVEPGETLEQAAVREVREEVGLEINNLRYIRSQPWPFPNSLMAGFRATCDSGEIKVDGKEIEEAAWYGPDSLPDTPREGTVAFDLISDWLSDRKGRSRE